MKIAPFTHIFILTAFLLNSFGPLPSAQADDLRLPVPGVMVRLSPPLDPPMLKGIKVHPDDPFRFDFILDKGDPLIGDPEGGLLKTEAAKLIKYFLASLTIPEQDLWVNLSPYEKDRIIPQSFGLTEMGRDLLAEDYMLKQITASLVYPEDEVGKKFWKRIYEEAAKKFGTTNIPVNTFNKVWIVPEKAVVYENVRSGTAYVVDSKLKVMLEQDYLSLEKHSDIASAARALLPDTRRSSQSLTKNDINALGSQIVREIVIPELTKEVNEDKNFAKLRQVYNSLILATWYKKKIRDSILERIYADKKKVAGVGYASNVNDVDAIYQRYLKAFKKGVYNYIKEEQDPLTQETIPRKYFSGGMDLAMGATELKTTLHTVHAIDRALLNNDNLEEISGQFDPAMQVQKAPLVLDRAMAAENRTLMDPKEVEHFFELSQLNKVLFPVYISFYKPEDESVNENKNKKVPVVWSDHFPLTQIEALWKEGKVQAFQEKRTYILFMWGPGKRKEWEKETDQPVKQMMVVPNNRFVRIRFIDTVEIQIGKDEYKVWIDEQKNIKIQHSQKATSTTLIEAPVDIPWGEKQKSIIKKGNITITKGNRGEYIMVYGYSAADSILRWDTRPLSTFDFQLVQETGDEGKYDKNFGSVDPKGALILTSGPRHIAGIVANTMKSFISQYKEFTKLKLEEIQAVLDEAFRQGVYDINKYYSQHPRARKDGVSATSLVITKVNDERGLMVGINAGNTVILRRAGIGKSVDLLSDKYEAGAFGANSTADKITLGYFVRSVNPGDLVVAVSPGILDAKVIKRIILQNDDPQEIRRQLMEEAKAVTDASKKINDMTVAVMKISPETGDNAQLAGPSADQAMTTEISDFINGIAERAYANMWNVLQVRRREKWDNAAWLERWAFVKKDIMYQQAVCERAVTEFLNRLLKSKFQDSKRVRSTLEKDNPWDINLHEFIVTFFEGRVFIIDPTYQQLIPASKPGPAYKVLTVELSRASDTAKLFGIPEAEKIWMIGIKQDPVLFERIKSIPGYEYLADQSMTTEDQERVRGLKGLLSGLSGVNNLPVEVTPYKVSPPSEEEINSSIQKDIIQKAIAQGEFFEVHFENLNEPVDLYKDPTVPNLNRAILSLSDIIANSVKEKLHFDKSKAVNINLTMVEVLKNALFHGNSLNVDLPVFIRINQEGVDIVDFGLGDSKKPLIDAVSGPGLIAGYGLGIQQVRSYGWDSFIQPLTPFTSSLDVKSLRRNVKTAKEYKASMQELTAEGQKLIGTVIHIEPIQKGPAKAANADQAMSAGEKLNKYIQEIVDQGVNGDCTRIVSRMISDPDLSVPGHEKGRFVDVRAAGEVYSQTSAYRVFYATQWQMAMEVVASLERVIRQVTDKDEINALKDLIKRLEDKPAIIRNRPKAKWAIIYEISRNNRLDNRQTREFIAFVKAAYKDRAMTVDPTGGIDLTPAKMNLQILNTGDAIKFHINPAMLQQLQNAPGFVPVIINIKPMNDLRKFLGISNAENLIGV